MRLILVLRVSGMRLYQLKRAWQPICPQTVWGSSADLDHPSMIGVFLLLQDVSFHERPDDVR